jgi:hypothetical protein
VHTRGDGHGAPTPHSGVEGGVAGGAVVAGGAAAVEAGSGLVAGECGSSRRWLVSGGGGAGVHWVGVQ